MALSIIRWGVQAPSGLGCIHQFKDSLQPSEKNLDLNTCTVIYSLKMAAAATYIIGEEISKLSPSMAWITWIPPAGRSLLNAQH